MSGRVVMMARFLLVATIGTWAAWAGQQFGEGHVAAGVVCLLVALVAAGLWPVFRGHGGTH